MFRLRPSERNLVIVDQPITDPRIRELVAPANARVVVRPGSAQYYGRLPIDLAWNRAKVLFSPTGRLPPYPVPITTAITIYDCASVTNPSIIPNNEAPAMAEKLRAAATKADLVFAISETGRQEIAECFGVPLDRIVVAPCSVSAPDVAPTVPAGLVGDAPFFLMVNPGRRNKNWEVVLAAFHLLKDDPAMAEHRLVLAGGLGDEAVAIQAAIAAMGPAGDDVVCLEYVSSSELLHLYRRATALAFMSTYEGFGMPPLEAMFHRLPVVTSLLPVLVEVTGDGAVHVADDDVEGLASALQRLASAEITDQGTTFRDEMIARGAERVAHFSWERSAEIVLAGLDQARSR
jgi:glycosyltransferase involved in cell wall biosynthesis